ncbi:unnamed protein product [Protopolystoma xenopodis]|uniref:TM2 domain-containing protein n=1 Tax=Protopolystoma xenopodis TaxID=117903 RepID=A0A3S5BM28_9PLAT|nr:unnamed protein product [Protopolystoma xenopodis]
MGLVYFAHFYSYTLLITFIIQKAHSFSPGTFEVLSASNASPPSNYLSLLQLACPKNFFMCEELPVYCLDCILNTSCAYGSMIPVECRPKPGVACLTSQKNRTEGPPPDEYFIFKNIKLIKTMVCRYCHQLPLREIACHQRGNCRQTGVARSHYETFCWASPDVICLGKRVFRRMLLCNWTSGKKYSIALALSLFLGGFGADRFYLGMWREGLGKLFSFGGLGVWSVVDFILIAVGYLKPRDDAVYW